MDPKTKRAAIFGLAILTLINLLNYLDRYVVSALVETLKKSELALSDAEAGFLMTGFIVVYMVASPLFGILGDRVSRTRLIAGGVAVWSIATALGGLTTSFFGLFSARALVGIGEAAYGTIAPALIADYFPARLRGRIYAIFFSAIPIGSALGYILGGVVDQRYGWRAAFYVAGLPGLLLAGLTLFLWDPPRGSQDEPSQSPGAAAPTAAANSGPQHESLLAGYTELLPNKTYLLTVLGYAAYTFALGGLAFWMPAFLERVRGFPRQQAVVQFGAVVVVTGFVGTFLGGWLGDTLLKKTKQAYLYVSGITTLLAVPFALIALTSSSPTFLWGGITIAELLLFASTGPVNSAIIAQVAPRHRAAAVAAANTAIHLLGDVPSPPLIGWISDHASLGQAVLLVPIAVALAGILWTLNAVRRV